MELKEKRFISALLSGKGSINFNKTIANKFGIYAAIMLGELCFKYDYWIDREQLTEDGYFFTTQEDIEKDTCLTPHQQRKGLNALENIVLVKKVGMPSKNYYKILFENLLDAFSDENLKPLLLKSLTTSDEDSSQQVIKDFNSTNKRELIKNTNEINNICISKDKALSPFITSSTDSLNRNNNYKAADGTSQNTALVIAYIKSQNLSEPVEKELIQWYQNNGKRLTGRQVIAKLDVIRKQTTDEEVIRDAIHKAFTNGWRNFYLKEEQKTTSNSESIPIDPNRSNMWF